ALMYQNGDTQTSGIVLMTAGGIGLLTMIISAIVKARSSTHG
nr:putative membrane protein [Emiliania huxleyi virus 86]